MPCLLKYCFAVKAIGMADLKKNHQASEKSDTDESFSHPERESFLTRPDTPRYGREKKSKKEKKHKKEKKDRKAK